MTKHTTPKDVPSYGLADAIASASCSVALEPETTARDNDRLIRLWVTVRSEARIEQLKRKSVIVHRGENRIEVTWKPLPHAVDSYEAALFISQEAAAPLGVRKLYPRSNGRAGDSITIIWVLMVD